MSFFFVEIVVPCYNEVERLDGDRFLAWLSNHHHYLFRFVNDGSTDGTLSCLKALAAANPAQVRVHDLRSNAGKAEAVRRGLLAILAAGAATYMGYFDADQSTPLTELPRLVKALENRPHCRMALGSRVLLMGRDIQRKAGRHYLGRLYATLASLVLDLPVYDTQCGAKVMRVCPDWCQLLASPFSTRWVFDVELISRLVRFDRKMRPDDNPRTLLVEVPVYRWVDIRGSKVTALDGLVALADLARLYFVHRRRWRAGA